MVMRLILTTSILVPTLSCCGESSASKKNEIVKRLEPVLISKEGRSLSLPNAPIYLLDHPIDIDELFDLMLAVTKRDPKVGDVLRRLQFGPEARITSSFYGGSIDVSEMDYGSFRYSPRDEAALILYVMDLEGKDVVGITRRSSDLLDPPLDPFLEDWTGLDSAARRRGFNTGLRAHSRSVLVSLVFRQVMGADSLVLAFYRDIGAEFGKEVPEERWTRKSSP